MDTALVSDILANISDLNFADSLRISDRISRIELFTKFLSDSNSSATTEFGASDACEDSSGDPIDFKNEITASDMSAMGTELLG